jgi:hypothetical protein
LSASVSSTDTPSPFAPGCRIRKPYVGDEGVGVVVVSLATGPGDSASDVNACSSSAGSIRPRFDARRRMPAAARADRKNLGGALS